MSKKNQHVVPHGGDWAVKGAGNSKATSVHSTQQEAIDRGAEYRTKPKIRTFDSRRKWAYSRKKLLRDRSLSTERVIDFASGVLNAYPKPYIDI